MSSIGLPSPRLPPSRLSDAVAKLPPLPEIRYDFQAPESDPSTDNEEMRPKVKVFKAYVGGVYRDWGLEAVSKWLSSLFRTHVEAAYQIVREEHLLPPTAAAVSQPIASITRHPSPSSSMSEGAEHASPSHPTGDTYDPCRRTQPRDNFAEQGSWLADGDGGGPKVIDQPRRKRQRSRSSPETAELGKQMIQRHNAAGRDIQTRQRE
ncbi:hypothetical protein BJV74DRAFT_990765 [Russula compacta]|nr:hypothetical protein BJV74DRAFT_990765 [Russula compacta]